MELNEAKRAELQKAAEEAAEARRKADTELAQRVASSSAAPGQELTPEAQQLKGAAAEMLESGTDPGFVAGYLERKQAQAQQTRREQRGSDRG